MSNRLQAPENYYNNYNYYNRSSITSEMKIDGSDTWW